MDVPFSNTIIVYYDKSITRLPRADENPMRKEDFNSRMKVFFDERLAGESRIVLREEYAAISTGETNCNKRTEAIDKCKKEVGEQIEWIVANRLPEVRFDIKVCDYPTSQSDVCLNGDIVTRGTVIARARIN